MDDHLRILQKWIESAAVGWNVAFENRERMRGEVQNHQEEDLYRGYHHRRVGKQLWIRLIAKTQDEAVRRQQKRPEQQGTFLSGPQDGELVRSGKVFVAVMEDVGDGEIVGERGRDQDNGREHDRGKRGDAGAARGFAEVVRVLATQDEGEQPYEKRIRPEG